MAGDFQVKKNVNEFVPNKNDGPGTPNIDRFRILKLVNDLYNSVNTGTVIGIQTIPVNSTAPTDAQFLVFNSGTGKYNPVSLSGAGTITDAGVLSINLINISTAGFLFNTTLQNQSSAITRSGTTATYTLTAHGFSSNDWVQIQGATQAQYNGWFKITVTGANAFTYKVAGSPTTPSTGTSHVDIRLTSENQFGVSLLTAGAGASGMGIFRTAAGKPTINFLNTQSSANYICVVTGDGTATSSAQVFGMVLGRTTTSCEMALVTSSTGNALDGWLHVLIYGLV